MRPTTPFARLLVCLAPALSLVLVTCTQEPVAPHRPVAGPLFVVATDTLTGASITTSKDDYLPGDTVQVVGDGWGANETVHFSLTREPDATGVGVVEWDVEAGDQGAFVTTFEVTDADFGATFTLTATGATSGSLARAVFTDGQTLTISSLNPSPPTAGNSFDVTVQVVLTSGSVWRRTRIRLSRSGYGDNPIYSNCFNTPDHTTNGTFQETVTIPASGTGWDSGESLIAGTYTIGARGYTSSDECDSDNDFPSSNDVEQSFTIAAAPLTPTTTTITSNLNPSGPGQVVTYTATVVNSNTSTQIGANGSVQFKKGGTSCSVGATNLGSAVNLNGSGQAVRALTSGEALAMTNGTIVRACYSGTATYDVSEGNLVQYVLSVTKLGTNQNPSNADSDPDFYTLGTSEFLITVTSPAGAPTVTSTIYLYDRIPSQLSNNGATAPTFQNGTGTWTCPTTETGLANSTAAIQCQTTDDLAAGGSLSIKIRVVPTATGSNIRNRVSLHVGVIPTRPSSSASCDALVICEDVDILTGPAPVISQPTTTTVSGSPNPSVHGESVTFTATVTVTAGGAAVTTGTVTFRFGGTDCTNGTVFASNVALNGSGQATGNRSFTVSESGSTIRACYSGASGYDPSSGTTTQTVNKAGTTLVLADDVDPTVVGQSFTLTATVSITAPGAGTLTGTVYFYDGGSCGTPGNPLGSDNTAPYQRTGTLPVGSYAALLACYKDDPNFGDSFDTEAHTVNMAGTTLVLSDDVDPTVYGQSFTLTAAVSINAPGVGTLTGTVYFYDGGTCGTPGNPLGSDNTAPYQRTGTLPVGSYPSLLACYKDDPNFGDSFDTEAHTVNEAGTSLVLADDIDPTVTGQSFTLTATVSITAPGAGTLTGTVYFYDGGTCAAPGTSLGSDNTAPYQRTGSLPVGSYSDLLACYKDDPNFLDSFDTEAHTVNEAGTSLTLTDNIDPTVFGQSFTLTAAVSIDAPGAGTLTGTVYFYQSGTCASPGTPLGSDNTAPYQRTGSLPVGSYPALLACYKDDPNFLDSEGTQAHTVDKANTNTSLTGTPDPSAYGQDVTFSATVTAAAPGVGTPGGNVKFYDFTAGGSCSDPTGGTLLATVALASPAEYTTNDLTQGNHTVAACYQGSDDFNPSGDTEPQTVNAAGITSTASVSPTSQQYSDKVNLSTQLDIAPPGTLNGQTLTGSVQFKIGTRLVGAPVPVSTTTLPLTVNLTPATPLTENPSGSPYTVYAIFTSTNSNFGSGTQTNASLGVTKETGSVYDLSHPEGVQVVSAGGSAPAVTVSGKIKELQPDLAALLAAAGDISNTTKVTVDLVGVSAGGATASCEDATLTSNGMSDYSEYLAFSCDAPAGLPVDTYEVILTIVSQYYVGEYRSVLTVFDPSLGFITGGGTILLEGDKTNFGFVGKAVVNKKTTVIKGSLLVIRHYPDGSIVRIKSNVFDGLAIQSDKSATFSGKANNSVDGNNYAFTAYVKDVATPGKGADLFGLFYPLSQIRTSSTLAGLAASAVTLTGGNIQVPQPGGPTP